MYRSRAEAKAEVFDHIECFYKPKRRDSTYTELATGHTEPVCKLVQTGPQCEHDQLITGDSRECRSVESVR